MESFTLLIFKVKVKKIYLESLQIQKGSSHYYISLCHYSNDLMIVDFISFKFKLYLFCNADYTWHHISSRNVISKKC